MRRHQGIVGDAVRFEAGGLKLAQGFPRPPGVAHLGPGIDDGVEADAVWLHPLLPHSSHPPHGLLRLLGLGTAVDEGGIGDQRGGHPGILHLLQAPLSGIDVPILGEHVEQGVEMQRGGGPPPDRRVQQLLALGQVPSLRGRGDVPHGLGVSWSQDGSNCLAPGEPTQQQEPQRQRGQQHQGLHGKPGHHRSHYRDPHHSPRDPEGLRGEPR
mmetsp:Transcript_5127/g.12021  ORF Transcript_5127/g.12021 Transcript_5127/m.12021 type:complete len:212 (-) Transcript_5127:287-922(-)